jgi:hypothetical protein
MKKTNYLFIALYLVSLIYASIHYFWMDGTFFLSFLNLLGVFSIILLIVILLLILSGYGYFDVFGYTFKKTYLMFARKINTMNLENQEKYDSYYSYTQYKIKNRLRPRPAFLLRTFLFVVINIVLSFVYAYWIY